MVARVLAGLAFGSKAVPLGLVVLAVLQQHLVIKRLSWPSLAVIMTLLVGAVACLLHRQASGTGAPPAVR